MGAKGFLNIVLILSFLLSSFGGGISTYNIDLATIQFGVSSVNT
jgi:hypothetical protein